MKCSFSAWAVGDAAVLAQEVFVGADFVVAEAAALQFQHRPLQLPLALPLQQPRRQLPVGGHGQGGGDLLAGLLPLLVFQAAAEGVLDGVAEIGLQLEAAQLVEQLGGQLRLLQPLDFQDLEDGRHPLAAQGRRWGRRRSSRRLALPGLAAADARHQLVEVLDLAVAEAQRGADADDLFRGAGKHLRPRARSAGSW